MKSFSILLVSTLLLILNNISIMTQNKLISTQASELTGIHFLKEVLKDNRLFFVDLARVTLELESGTGTISALEVFCWPNKTKQKADAEAWLMCAIQELDSSGWKLQTSVRDPSYLYLSRDSQNQLMYILPGKKEANLYIGKLNGSSVFDPGTLVEEGNKKIYSKKSLFIGRNLTDKTNRLLYYN